MFTVWQNDVIFQASVQRP